MTLASLEPADSLDAELALSAARGDRAAFAAIYDRYADRLFDFCAGMLRDRDVAADCVQDAFVIAATKMDQLQDPQRLRAWLYAIARNEALARIRARRRELPSDDLPETPSGDPDLASLAARTELADLIAEALGGLTERDRTVYELAYRHGLDGPELGAALGVSHTNANTLVARLRDGIERALGALLVCRGVRADPQSCPDLAAVLAEWDGTFTVLVRKRVARHIDGCEVCDGERRRRVSPAALLGSVPVVLPAPVLLRDQALGHAAPVLPAPDGHQDGFTDGSWWPAVDFDTSDLDSTNGSGSGHGGTRTPYLRAALTAALVVIGIAGVAQLSAPLRLRVEPVSETRESTTGFTANSIAGTPSNPRPVTTGAASTSAQAPPSTAVPALSRTAAPQTTPPRELPGTEAPPTDMPRTTVNQSFEPSRQSTTTRTTTSETSTSTSTATSSPTSTTTSTTTSTPTTTTTTTGGDPIE